jgi:hypothetical protein
MNPEQWTAILSMEGCLRASAESSIRNQHGRRSRLCGAKGKGARGGSHPPECSRRGGGETASGRPMVDRESRGSPQDRCAKKCVPPGGIPTSTLVPPPLRTAGHNGCRVSRVVPGPMRRHCPRQHSVWPSAAVFAQLPASITAHFPPARLLREDAEPAKTLLWAVAVGSICCKADLNRQRASAIRLCPRKEI